jgi:two-component system response regulator HupR/HoxA
VEVHGAFRCTGGSRSEGEDLFYRLAAFPIVLPPLRVRRDDIALLADRFFSLACRRHGKTLSGIHEGAHSCLMRYDWPGNVRQLQNEMQRAVVLAEEGDWLRAEHLSAPVRAAHETEGGDAGADGPHSLKLSLARAEFEAQHISKVLEQEGGNVSRAATVLGMSRVGLHRKLKDFGLR